MALPSTTSEQRRSIYEDVETLIIEGFLTHEAMVRGHHVCFRSLCPGDLFLLRHRSRTFTDVEIGWKVWTLAGSIWMVDGVCLLGDTQTQPRIAQTIRRLPKTLTETLMSLVLGLFSRQSRALAGAEAFSYEDYSRQLWRMHGRQVPRKGIAAADQLGSNHVQRIWLAFNEMEDERERDRVYWESAKLGASVHSPKGIQKIDRSDQQRRREEDERRQRVMDLYYYTCKGLVDQDGRVKGDPAGGLVRGAHTVEELEDEMRKWVTGEQDEHDRVVAAYKERIRKQFEEEKRVAAQRRLALQQALARRQFEMEQETPGRSPTLIAYTPAQIQEMLAGRQTGARTVGWGGGKQHYLHDKYLQQDPTPGALQVGEQGSLQERIERRQVPFHGRED